MYLRGTDEIEQKLEATKKGFWANLTLLGALGIFGVGALVFGAVVDRKDRIDWERKEAAYLKKLRT